MDVRHRVVCFGREWIRDRGLGIGISAGLGYSCN